MCELGMLGGKVCSVGGLYPCVQFVYSALLPVLTLVCVCYLSCPLSCVWDDYSTSSLTKNCRCCCSNLIFSYFYWNFIVSLMCSTSLMTLCSWVLLKLKTTVPTAVCQFLSFSKNILCFSWQQYCRYSLFWYRPTWEIEAWLLLWLKMSWKYSI